MTLDLHALALDFHRRHQYVPVAVAEAAMCEGAEAAVVMMLMELRQMRSDMIAERQKANTPQ